MPALEYFLVCRSMQVDLFTDEVSFLNMLEDIAPEAFPHVIPIAVAVSLWNFQAGEEGIDYQATLVVKVPGNAEVPFPMNFSRGPHRCRAVQSIAEIPVNGPGDVQFEVLLNGVHGATHTVKVHPVGSRAVIVGDEYQAGEARHDKASRRRRSS